MSNYFFGRLICLAKRMQGMYTYDEIQLLLSQSAKTILQLAENYASFSTEAENIITTYSALDSNSLKLYAKTCFVYVIEGLVANRLNTLSPEFIERTKNNYLLAFKMLDRIREKIKAAAEVTSRVGNIESDYNDWNE